FVVTRAASTELYTLSLHDALPILSANSVATQNTLNKLDVIEETIDKYYLEDVDEQTLENGIYKGMVESLGDPYSTYYAPDELEQDRKSTRLNSSHVSISYAVFCLK